MANDLGGGLRGEGGTLNDGEDAVITDPTADMQQIDYSNPPEVPDRELGAISEPAVAETAAVDSSAPTRQYILISEEPDRLTCQRFKDGESFTGEGDLELILITKPQNARRSIWEDKIINGILYSYPEENNHSLRIATRVGEDPEVNPPVFQRYVNPYIPDFSLIYAVAVEDGTEVGATTLIDMNNDGRQWAIERPLTVAEQA